ncbi:hypothetical protein DQ238_20040 [Geodermatophilus sp. TF02-6]|uniref:hypothetical protein n=1 Tax=Geodermatophilus sp. TF02-6 TaxID=2250575 RepID=UPI000DEBA60D|nr:hypothetical protein [Geodermatophilus sp. TF02-6]RBY75318.1 hypothetical protein DQ238_20040 [Geodermatophilus sp. TF02-6]
MWTPEGGVLPDGSVILRKDARAPFEFEIMDGFAAFPLNLGVRLGDPHPPDWWMDEIGSERVSRAGQVSIVESLRSQKQ